MMLELNLEKHSASYNLRRSSRQKTYCKNKAASQCAIQMQEKDRKTIEESRGQLN